MQPRESTAKVDAIGNSIAGRKLVRWWSVASGHICPGTSLPTCVGVCMLCSACMLARSFVRPFAGWWVGQSAQVIIQV